jgi:maltose O-acetyltransferase
VIIPEIKIGKKTIIGAGSVVTRDIPDNVVAYGNPAKVIRDNNTQCYKLSDLN